MDFLQQSSIPDYTTEKITASEWQLQLLKDWKEPAIFAHEFHNPHLDSLETEIQRYEVPWFISAY